MIGFWRASSLNRDVHSGRLPVLGLVVLLVATLFPLRFARAELIMTPRYEYIGGAYELANRLQLKSKFDYSYRNFVFYIEGFGEYDAAASAQKFGRTTNRAYLQEAYLEYKRNSFYFRLGRQAMRWSESWSLPSLDIWTGRKFNRLFFDNFSEQLNHSTGLLASYAGQTFSADVVAVSEIATNQFPTPYNNTPEIKDKSGYGARLKWNIKNFGISALAARAHASNSVGASLNYAFEQAVPKLEYGNVAQVVGAPSTVSFLTAGVDLFLGNWILLPQVTFADGSSTYYSSLQWNPHRHDIQAQVFWNSSTQDTFANLSYGYNWTDHFMTAGFVQDYEGPQPGLYRSYQDITGHQLVAGLRSEFNF